MKRTLLAACTAAAALAFAGAALAHVEPTVGTAPAGGEALIQFQVPHGCAGAATTGLAIQIPAGVLVAKPRPKPGWKVTIVPGKGKSPVGSIAWSGGSLPDDEYDTFDVFLSFPNAPGRDLAFPAVQTCGKTVVRWIEPSLKGQAEPEHPLPTLTLVKSAGGMG